jgi:broad specificity phosphatase PhoE
VIYLFRHGETDCNKFDIVQGHSPAKLNETGIAQVTSARPEIEQIKPRIIYSSDLARAEQSAKILNQNMNLPIIFDARLREISRPFCLLGKHRSELTKQQIRDLTHNPKIFGAGAETREEVFARALDFLKTEIAAKNVDNALIVSHGLCIRMLKWAETHPNFDNYEYEHTPKTFVGNAGYILLDPKILKQTLSQRRDLPIKSNP